MNKYGPTRWTLETWVIAICLSGEHEKRKTQCAARRKDGVIDSSCVWESSLWKQHLCLRAEVSGLMHQMFCTYAFSAEQRRATRQTDNWLVKGVSSCFLSLWYYHFIHNTSGFLFFFFFKSSNISKYFICQKIGSSVCNERYLLQDIHSLFHV